MMALLGAIAYGIQPTFTKLLLNLGINSTTLIFYRFVFVALIMGFYLLARKKLVRPSIKQIRDLIFFGILGYGGTIFLLTESYNYLPMGQATMIYFTYPVCVALMMVIFYKEKISFLKILALGLALLGLFFLGNFKVVFNFKGIFMALGLGLAFATYLVSVNKSTYKSMEAEVLIFYLALVNIVFFGIKGAVSSSLAWLPKVGFLYIIATVTLTIMALLMITSAIRKIGAVNTSIICVFEPVITLMCGIIIFREVVNWSIFFGSLLMIVSVFFVTWEGFAREKKKLLRN